MKISTDTINKLADLAYLKISDKESLKLIEDFGRIVEMIDNISSVQVHDLNKELTNFSTLRNDVVEHSPTQKAISRFEQFEEETNCFIVPKVVEQN